MNCRQFFKEAYKAGYKKALLEAAIKMNYPNNDGSFATSGNSDYDEIPNFSTNKGNISQINTVQSLSKDKENKIVSTHNSFHNNLYNLYKYILDDINDKRDGDYFEINFNRLPKAKKLQQAIESDFQQFSSLISATVPQCIQYLDQIREELNDIYKKLQVPARRILWKADVYGYDYAIIKLWNKIKKVLGIKGKDQYKDYFRGYDTERKEDHKEHLAWRREQARERAVAEKEATRRSDIIKNLKQADTWQELKKVNRKAYNLLVKEIKEVVDIEGDDAQWEDGGHPEDSWSMRVYRRVTKLKYYKKIGEKYGLTKNSYKDIVYKFIEKKYGFREDNDQPHMSLLDWYTS